MKWSNKYRPKLWKHFYGNENVIFELKKQLDAKDTSDTWLVTGVTGSGKTTIARLMARRILGVPVKEDIREHPDFDEVNVGSDRGIDKIKELMNTLRFKPREAEKKVLVLDECHQLLGPAASVLLKPLEEPPEHVVVILATNEPEKLLKPLRDRASLVNLKTLDHDGLVKLIERIAEVEDIKFCTPKFINTLAQHFGGETRRCIDTLQKLAVTHKDAKIDIAAFEQAVVKALDSDIIQACNLLSALYTDQFEDACQLSQQFENPVYLVRNLLDLNNYLLENCTGVKSYVSYPRMQLIKKIGKTPPTIANILRVQQLLFTLKEKLAVNIVNDPKQMMLVFAARSVLAQKKK